MGWPGGWIEWVAALSFGVTLLAFPFAYWGFVLAQEQIRATKTVAEAARDTAQDVEDRFLRARSMLIIPLLRSIENAISLADHANDSGALGDAFKQWRLAAPTAASSVADQDLATRLRTSVVEARFVEKDLRGGAGVIGQSASDVMSTISGLIDELSMFVEGTVGTGSGEYPTHGLVQARDQGPEQETIRSEGEEMDDGIPNNNQADVGR